MKWPDFSAWKRRAAGLVSSARSYVRSFVRGGVSVEEDLPEETGGDQDTPTTKLRAKRVSAVKPYRRSQGMGQLLIRKRLATRSQIDEALLIQKERRSGASPVSMCDLYLSSILVDLGHVDEESLAKEFSVHWQIPVVRLSHARVRDELLDLIPSDLARRFGVFPYDKVGKVVILAVFDPTIEDIITYIAKQIGYNIKPTIGIRSDIMQFLDSYYSPGKEERPLPASKKTSGRRDAPAKSTDEKKPAIRKKPIPREEPSEANTEKEKGVAVLEVDKGRFTGLAEITLHQQAETWITGQASVEKEALPVDPALIALFTEGHL
ncbi:hypothetical protein ACFL01_05090 [Planctomycetota bacterium]